MNTSLKGLRGEKEVAKILEKRFYFPYTQIARVKRGYGKKDFFGLFDILAVHREIVMGVQVKRKSMSIKEAQRLIEEISESFERPSNFIIALFWRGNHEEWQWILR